MPVRYSIVSRFISQNVTANIIRTDFYCVFRGEKCDYCNYDIGLKMSVRFSVRSLLGLQITIPITPGFRKTPKDRTVSASTVQVHSTAQVMKGHPENVPIHSTESEVINVS